MFRMLFVSVSNSRRETSTPASKKIPKSKWEKNNVASIIIIIYPRRSVLGGFPSADVG